MSMELIVCHARGFSNGTNVSRVVVKKWKMTQSQDDLPHQKLQTTLKELTPLVRRDQRLTVRMFAYELGMNRETVRTILTDNLGTRKVCTKMVPKLLSDDHKEYQVNVCRNILETIDEEPEFLGKVITGDET